MTLSFSSDAADRRVLSVIEDTRGKFGQKATIWQARLEENSMGRLPLTALEGFLLAARLGNLSRAATQLNLTVSALSHQMRGLEERLGQRLLVRGSRGVGLTAEGERLLEGIALPFAAIERALRQCQVPSDDILTLSLMPSMASSWLLPRLPDFLAAHPE